MLSLLVFGENLNGNTALRGVEASKRRDETLESPQKLGDSGTSETCPILSSELLAA